MNSLFVAGTNPSSPFKKPLIGNLNQSILGGLTSSNASDSGSSMATTSSGSSGSSSASASSKNRPPSLTDSPFQSGHLPTIADVRSPDVLQEINGTCECLSHPMQVNNDFNIGNQTPNSINIQVGKAPS